MTDPKGHWSDGGKVWEGMPGGDYQHGYADGIEWATVHAQPASPLRGRDAEFIARTIALSYGRTPDDMTSVGEMCDGDNRPVPIWMVYEEQADAILSACASPPEQPAADNVKTLLETIDAKNARIAELEEALGKAVLAPVEGRESWALLYLHDWDPPKEGQEHKWEPGKNIFPELHGKTFSTLQEADAARRRMSNPDKYWVRRFNSPTAPEPELPKARPMGQS